MNAAHQSAAHNAQADHRPGNAARSFGGSSRRKLLRLSPERAEFYGRMIETKLRAEFEHQINFAQIDSIVKAAHAEAAGDSEPITPDTPLSRLELSQRTLNALEEHGYRCLRDLQRLTDAEILSWPNASDKFVAEVRAALAKAEAELNHNPRN